MISDREKRKDKILEYLQDGASFAVACKAVGIGRRTGYDWRTADPAFDAAVRGILESEMPEDPLWGPLLDY